VGDRVPVFVNSGEMIFTTEQQKRISDVLDGKNTGGSGISGNVDFVLRGKDLYGSLKNYEKDQNKKR
jgi:hypothetical protein